MVALRHRGSSSASCNGGWQTPLVYHPQENLASPISYLPSVASPLPKCHRPKEHLANPEEHPPV